MSHGGAQRRLICRRLRGGADGCGIIKPRNPDYSPIILEPEDEGEVRVIGEFVSVVGDTGRVR